ncbi:MAG: YxlC family protein [Clostridiaceae bacterium]|mgnify:CR=1 FL=1|nr:YxlC family protein [Clostridiaceae bacterium]
MIMENDNEKVIHEMKDAIDFVDNNLQVNKPNIEIFELLVSQVEERKRICRNIELLLFLLVAITILSISAGTLILNTMLFILIQAVTFVTIPIIIFIWFRDHVGRVNN